MFRGLRDSLVINAVINLFFLLSTTYAFACSCWYSIPTFCGSVNHQSTILRVVIKDTLKWPYEDFALENHLLTVKVIDFLNRPFDLNGDATLNVIDGILDQCGGYLDRYRLNDTVLVTGRLDTNHISSSNGQRLRILSWNYCRTPDILYKNGILYGPVAPGIDTLAYDEFVINLESCLELVKVDLIDTEDIQCYPNPVEDIITVQSAQSAIRSVDVMDLSGRLLLHTTVAANTHQLFVGDLPPGVYIIRAETTNKHTMVRKIVVI